MGDKVTDSVRTEILYYGSSMVTGTQVMLYTGKL
jgi:hypothetical protein